MAQETTEDSVQRFRFESETESEKGNQEKSNKLVKTGVILMLCFLLLNFVLVVIVMNRRSEISSSSANEEFSGALNQTNETAQIVDKLKSDLKGIEKWRNSTDEKFESHQFQIESLLNQTKINEQLEALENENGELKNSHEELKEQLQSLSQKLDQLENNFSRLTSPPAENENRGIYAPQLKSITSCSATMEILSSLRSNKQTIYTHGNNSGNNKSLEVLCDFETDGGGWTIIQKRSSGPKQEFNKTWDEYKNGFGSLDKNFWLGLENIHALTQSGDQELRIQLEDFEGENKWAKYSRFSISGTSDFYRLSLGGFHENSTLGNSILFNDGKRFSTTDKDNDGWDGYNCPVLYGGNGGWWFGPGCSNANLHGLYYEKGETVPDQQGIWWSSWKGTKYSFAKTEMKIRTRK